MDVYARWLLVVIKQPLTQAKRMSRVGEARRGQSVLLRWKHALSDIFLDGLKDAQQ